jgi:hypothetical protein
MTRKYAALAVTAALTLAACQDSPQPTAPEQAPKPGPAQIRAVDPEVLAQQIPGFGGYFLDQAGRPTVFLTDAGQRGRAEAVLGGRVEVKQGRHTWSELSSWHGKANNVLSEAGVVLTDLDEARNVVRVGVENAVLAPAIRARLQKLGVPAEAVVVEQTEPFYRAATLRDVVRPIRAGLQINFGSYVCTLGFNASHSGGSSFVTNSHCTNVQGGTEGTRYYQPSTVQPQIATEASDPAYFTGGSCPSTRRCRRSDSSRAAYLSGALFERGRIARTGSRGSLSGSLTISTTSPYFTITSEGSASVGTQVNKIGRTTGWTYGNVTSTCVNVNVSGTNITQLCQNVVSGGVGGGDSGSPVFTWSGSGSNVTLVGILWGGNSSGNQFIFSPLSAVESELGALTTTF